MSNPNEEPALYADPKLALEVTRELKTICSQEQKDKLQDVFGPLTERDLIFSSLGKSTGLRAAETSFRSIRSIFAKMSEKEA